LCARPYPLHPGGCPNFRRKEGCPPGAPLLGDFYDLARPCYVVWNVFSLGEHARAMRSRHPGWSDRQVYCCLYWQPRARAALEAEIEVFMAGGHGDSCVARCPEAMGLDVTETMRLVGVALEWPPLERAVLVAFAGVRRVG
jgi:hypothetical protein